jgi:hypothetical protein
MYSLHAGLRVGLRDGDLPACAPRTRPSATTTSGPDSATTRSSWWPDARLALHRGARDRPRDHGRHLRGCLSGDPELQRPTRSTQRPRPAAPGPRASPTGSPWRVDGTSVFKWQANSTYDLEPPTWNNAGFQDGDTVGPRGRGAPGSPRSPGRVVGRLRREPHFGRATPRRARGRREECKWRKRRIFPATSWTRPRSAPRAQTYV